MQEIKEKGLITETVELPDELVKLAEDLDIDIQKIVADRLKILGDIFP